jgi:hypothetical protein
VRSKHYYLIIIATKIQRPSEKQNVIWGIVLQNVVAIIIFITVPHDNNSNKIMTIIELLIRVIIPTVKNDSLWHGAFEKASGSY